MIKRVIFYLWLLSGLFGLVSLASDPFNCVESNGFVEGCIFQIEATDTEWMGIPAGELPENLSEEQIIALVALVAVALWFFVRNVAIALYSGGYGLLDSFP